MASGRGTEPAHLGLGGIGFPAPDDKGKAPIPSERKEARSREEALAQRQGEEMGGNGTRVLWECCFPSGDAGLGPLPPTYFNVLSSELGCHRPRDLKLGGSFLLTDF